MLRPLHLFTLFCALYAIAAPAQQVYRCEHGGQISYSHEPCLGATAIDTTPTQGLDKWTGKTRQHREVQREIWNKQYAQAIRPLTRKSPEEFQTSVRRQPLDVADQLQCTLLDQRLPELAHRAAQAQPARRLEAEQALFEARRQFRELRC